MNHTLLSLDTRDDRRELATLLDKLPPVERLGFLKWACAQAQPTERGHLPAPVPGGYDEVVRAAYRCDEASARLTRMVYADVVVLLANYAVDAGFIARSLEALVRRRRQQP